MELIHVNLSKPLSALDSINIYPYPDGVVSNNVEANFYGTLSPTNAAALKSIEDWASDPTKNVDLSILLSSPPKRIESEL